MDIHRIWNNDNQLHALTGLTKAEAIDLLQEFEHELKNKKDQKEGNGGRPAKLDNKGIFVMFMMFFRHYITFEALGALFDLNDSNVKRWIDVAQPTLKEVLKKKNYSHLIVPPQKKKSRRPLNNNEKSIWMALNNLYGDPKTS